MKPQRFKMGFQWGITILIFLCFMAFFFWTRDIGELLPWEFLAATATAFFIGLCIEIFLHYFRITREFNVIGISMFVFALIVYWMFGGTPLGQIPMHQLLYAFLVSGGISFVIVLILLVISRYFL